MRQEYAVLEGSTARSRLVVVGVRLSIALFLIAAAPFSARAQVDAGVPADAGTADARTGDAGTADAGGEGAPDAGGVAPSRIPPRLIEHITAEPPEGLEDRPARVLLEILVATDGSVAEVRVVESAGAGLEPFDELALGAARQFRFEPAQIDGRAVAARIRYVYVFEPRVEEVVEVEETVVETEPEPEVEATEGEGEPEGEDADEPEAEAQVFRARAAVDPPPREITRRVLRREVLTRMPGTRGDALRVVELLPGVGRPAFGGGVLIIRGSSPGDSQVFLDGNPVPLLYHFGGLTSFYNSYLLDRIDFIPGNFGVRYGRKIGGILEVDPRDPRTDGYHGYAEFGVIDVSASFEGPIGDDFAFALGFRRSLIDLFLELVQETPDGPSILTAPVYYDYQAIATWTPTDNDRFRLLIYGSTDDLRLLLRQSSDTDFAVRGNVGLGTQFHRFQLSWRHVEGIFQQDIQAGFGLNIVTFNLGDALKLESTFYPMNFRSEWALQLSPAVRTIFGMDMQVTPLELVFRGPQPTQGEGAPPSDNLSTSQNVDFTTGLVLAYRPAFYVESNLRIAEMLDIAMGVRADWYREIRSLTVDPRLIARLTVTDWLTLRTGVGLFSQPPEFQESAQEIGNPNLSPIHSLHVGLGTDFRFRTEGFSISLDGFYKHLWDRVIATERGAPPFFENGGLGRIYGLEVGARLEPDGPIPIYGFVSYTLSRSERQDRPTQDWRLFDQDQTHILTVALVGRLPLEFELGATFRLVSGNPLTPVIGSVLDVRTGTYQPLYGAVNSDRNPFFHRLDVRIQKRFDIGDQFRLTLYLDIQNIYNNTNREGVLYNYDYSQSQDLPGLPIIPAFGIRGEL